MSKPSEAKQKEQVTKDKEETKVLENKLNDSKKATKKVVEKKKKNFLQLNLKKHLNQMRKVTLKLKRMKNFQLNLLTRFPRIKLLIGRILKIMNQ